MLGKICSPFYLFIYFRIESPRFTVEPENVTTYVGGSVWINCEGTGNPIPNVNYIKAEGELNETRLITLPNHTLYGKQLVKKDSGAYYCWLIHSHGSASAEFIINVKGASVYCSTY